MGPFLIDTNIIIDYLSAKLPEKCLDFMHFVIDSNPATSVICKIEALSFNFIPEERIQMEAFIHYLKILDLSDEVVIETINIRQQRKIKTPDAIVAATAITKNLTLVTRNFKDFASIPNIKIYNPWE
jgi:hypothetical protein